jgi:hypothetical protein
MHERPRSLRALSSAAVFAMVAASVALAAPLDDPRPGQGEAKKDQKTTATNQVGKPSSGTVASQPKAAPKAAETPAPATPKADDRPPSFLPRAGADSSSNASPKMGGSSNPFKPRSVAQIRQSNRLKAAGYSGNVMDDGELLLALNSAMKLMAKAEYDYSGHRGKAIQEIDVAIRKIHSKAGKSLAPMATPPPKGKTGANSKAAASQTRDESDAILREAQKELKKIESHITNGGNAKALAATKASVKMAIEELDIALDSH